MSTITGKGQTTIPKPIREHLRVGPGDQIEFIVEPDGSVRVIAKTLRLSDLHGVLPRPQRAVSVEAMNEAVLAGAARRFRRARDAEPTKPRDRASGRKTNR